MSLDVLNLQIDVFVSLRNVLSLKHKISE